MSLASSGIVTCRGAERRRSAASRVVPFLKSAFLCLGALPGERPAAGLVGEAVRAGADYQHAPPAASGSTPRRS